MGNLRDGFFTQRPQGELTAQDLDALDASGMNSLSRGWAAGRIGNEANALSAEEMNLRASGDVAGADALRQQIKGLDLRRGAYAPAVGRVEDVHGLGDAGSYIAGQVGQGLASMADPMAVSAGLATAGRFLPGVAGRVAQGAALGVPYLMNQRQLTGEFGNAAYQDPELIARTSPTQLRDDANLYGAGAAVLDTALTGIVGRQVSGLSRAGGAMARKSVMGAGTKAVVGLGMEGATETAQSMGSQYTLGRLNPNRDTSGDFSENLNSFVGGAVGAGPFAAAGAYAEAGHNRVGAGVDRVKDAAGTVIDMANGNETVQKAKGMFGKAKDGVIDLAKNDDGAASASALLDNLKAGAQELKSRGETSLEELSILRNTPPDDVLADETNAKLKAWDAENAPKRAELIASKLQGMKDNPEAAGLLEGLAEPDDGVYAQNLEKAAQFLIAEHPVGRVNERAATLGENLGKIAGVAGPAIGRGAVAVGKGVARFAKAVLSGAKDEASKKNAQAAEESFGEWRDRNYGVRGQEAADSALKEGASYNKAVEFSQRAELAGSYASDMAQRGKGGMKYAQLAKHLAYTVANMLDTDAAKLDVKSRMVRLNRLTTDFHDIYKDAAPEVLTQLGVILGPQASPAVKHMIQQLEAQMSPGGRQAVVSERDQLARRVVGLISPKAQNALMRQGVNINTPGGREKVLGIMEDFADKISSTPHARAALDGLLGADSVRSVMELLNGQEEPEAAEVIDDRSEIGDVEKEQAEKLVVKGSGAKIYAYGDGAGLRSSDERRDPFAASEKADIETGVVKRPAMFTKGQKLFGGADAIEKKIADLKKQLASDPAYPDHDNYRIESKSAWDVMQDNKMQPGKVLQLYRDYLTADSNIEGAAAASGLLRQIVRARKGTDVATPEERRARKGRADAWLAANPGKSVEDYKASESERRVAALAGPQAKILGEAEAYFKERFIVVAEQISNRDPEKVTATEALALFQDGRRKLSAVRRDSQDLSEADQNLATSEANILYFTGRDEKGKPATLPVQAGKLVHFVRKQQGQSSRMDAEESGKSFSNATKDAEFLTDLMTGIGMMIDSGHATGMPYMLNRFGKAESFTQGVPKSLMLATQTAGAKEFGDEKRREKQPVKTAEELAPDDEAVAAEQTLERSDETEGSIDDVVDEAPMTRRTIQDALTRAEKVELNSKTSHAERLAYIKSLTKGMSIGEAAEFLADLELTNANGAAFNPDAKTNKTSKRDKTPLDFSEGQDVDAADDETTDVLKRTKLGGKSAYSTDIGPEPKGKAADAAVHRAAAIGAAWNRSEAEGMEMIEMRFRMAAAPAYSENKNEAVGGPHYIAPVAAFVNATNLAGMDLGPKELKEFSSIRARVAQVLLSPEVSKTERVKLARLMSTDPAKVTAMNVDQFMSGLAARVEATDPAPRSNVKTSDVRLGQSSPVFFAKPLKGKMSTPASQKAADLIGPLFDGLPPSPINLRRTAGAAVPARMPQKIDNTPRTGDFPPRPLLQGGAAAPLGKPSGGRKLNAMAAQDKWMYHGTRAKDEALIQPDGSLLLKPSKNYGGKTNGVSFTHDLASATDYATRVKGGGPKGFKFTGAKVLKIDRAALTSIEEETFGEWADYSGKDVVIPKGMYSIEPVARTKALLEDSYLWKGGDYSFLDYVKDNYGTYDEDNAYGDDMTREEYLDQVIDPDSGSSPADVAEAQAILRDEFGRGRKLNAMSVDIHTDLERGGFAATHDSPIRHEGKFDWRKHTGKGEGNAAFGAGTYLSTADGVHRSYKDQFTAKVEASRPSKEAIDKIKSKLQRIREALRIPELAEYRDAIKRGEELPARLEDAYNLMKDEGFMPSFKMIEAAVEVSNWNKLVKQLAETTAAYQKGESSSFRDDKSPTYEVSVDIKPEQLLDWNAPLSEQSELVQNALSVVMARLKGYDEYRDPTGERIYHYIEDISGGDAGGASDYLQSLGILGHKYAAAGGKNDTHPNYVIYDDSKITTNYVHFNQQQGPSRVASQADMDEARTYVTKVLGPRIKVEFKNLTGYSGEFIDAKNVIEISTTAAAGTMGTAWHEAMHVFFRDFVKGNPGMIKTFEGLVNDPKHLAKLHALLSGFPAAQAQLHSGEERLAYTYQFWKAGLLQVDAEAKTWLQKIGKFFRRVMGMVRDSERALELFTAFDKGAMQDPSAAAQVIEKALGKGQWTLRQRQKLDALVQGVAAMTMPSAEVLEISVSAKARKLSRMLFTNPGEGESGSDKEGYLNARRRMATKYNNMFAQAIGDLNEGDQNIVQGYLQKETELSDIAYEPHRAAVKSIRSLLQRFHQYMTESGMEIGHAGDKYYPVVWSLDALLSNKAEFIEMLVTKYASNLDPLNGDIQKAAERVYEALINKDGVDAHMPASREDGVLAPFFASQNGRTLPWLAAADREKYMQKNMIGTLSRYFHQGARSTEYFRRFGQDGVKLDAMLYGTKSWNPATKSEDRATDGIYHELLAASKEKSGMTPEQQKAWLTRQMRDVTRSVSAMEGTLGKDVSPTMRKFSSWMNVYQNIRLLPLSLFSSFVDPLGLLARGGTFQESYDAFLSGMREVFAGWRDAFRDMPAERQKNEWERLAEFVGTVDAAMFSHHVADEYSSVYMSPAAKKINDKMFVLNGMEAWNRGMRVAATKSAVKFIERHAKNADPAHSKRWLQELGLTAAQVYTDADGGLITDRHVLAQAHNMPLADATKKMEAIHYAINRWVEGAVLTPNAAQRPAWSSDPHYSMLFHLKQFSYSFHQTILKRAVAEMKHGNMAPMGAFIWYIPTMIAADITKGLIQGGGELPPYMKGYSAGDWLLHAGNRAGLAGIGVIGVDAAEDVASLGGPAVEQVIDGLRDPLERTAVNALPLHSVFAMAIN